MNKDSLNSCFFCRAPLYRLNDGRVKCSVCAKRYSPKQIEKTLGILQRFCHDRNAHQTCSELGITYATAAKYYKLFRSLAASSCENDYEANRHKVGEYEEYLYIESSKRRTTHAVFEAQNFITFDYGGRVYNVLMPSLAKYKDQFARDGLEGVYNKELSRFMRRHKIIKISARHNTITSFWEYFEHFIKTFKGVSESYFAYYLKEAEFKFNHEPSERESILTALYFQKESR